MKQINQHDISAGEYSPRFTTGAPFLIEGCMVLQCIKGHAAFKLDFKTYEITEGNVVFLFNDMVIELEEHSADFTVRYISVPEEQVFEIYVNITSNKFWDMLYLSPVQRFNNTYNLAIDNWIKECLLVTRICRKTAAEKVIPRLLMSLFLVMEDILSHNTATQATQLNMAPWIIIGKFFVLLSRHYTTEHKVAFYADALNITPDYLSVITKEYTGFPPKETIDGKLVLAMKALLDSTSLSVKNIAERLHYDDTSHLCKVFRRHTGMSPAEYRRQHR